MKIIGIAAVAGLAAGYFGGAFVGMVAFIATICAIASLIEAAAQF
jgi:hypothetical protein